MSRKEDSTVDPTSRYNDVRGGRDGDSYDGEPSDGRSTTFSAVTIGRTRASAMAWAEEANGSSSIDPDVSAEIPESEVQPYEPLRSAPVPLVRRVRQSQV